MKPPIIVGQIAISDEHAYFVEMVGKTEGLNL